RNQLARSTGGGCRRAAQPDRSRRDRADHDARPRAHRHHPRPRVSRAQRALRRRLRRREYPFRLPDEAGSGDAQQRHRPDAGSRPGCSRGRDVSEDPAVTYGLYLRIDDLLALQQPRSAGPEHDEMLFIVIHQVYELWFKELLHEFDRVITLLTNDDSHRAQHTLGRILTILKVMVAQLDILET